MVVGISYASSRSDVGSRFFILEAVEILLILSMVGSFTMWLVVVSIAVVFMYPLYSSIFDFD